MCSLLNPQREATQATHSSKDLFWIPGDMGYFVELFSRKLIWGVSVSHLNTRCISSTFSLKKLDSQPHTTPTPFPWEPMAYNHFGSIFLKSVCSWLQATEIHAACFKLTESLGVPKNQAWRLATRKCPKSSYKTSEDSMLSLLAQGPACPGNTTHTGHGSTVLLTSSSKAEGDVPKSRVQRQGRPGWRVVAMELP